MNKELTAMTAKVIARGKGTLPEQARGKLLAYAREAGVSEQDANRIIREQLDVYYRTCPQCGSLRDDVSLVCPACGYTATEATGGYTLEKDMKKLQQLLVEIKSFQQPSAPRRVATALFHLFTLGLVKLYLFAYDRNTGLESAASKRRKNLHSLVSRAKKLTEKMGKLYGGDTAVANLLHDIHYESEKAANLYKQQHRRTAILTGAAVACCIGLAVLNLGTYNAQKKAASGKVGLLLEEGKPEEARNYALSITDMHVRAGVCNVLLKKDVETFLYGEEYEKAIIAASLVWGSGSHELLDEIAVTRILRLLDDGEVNKAKRHLYLIKDSLLRVEAAQFIKKEYN